ncbi:MAG TPA: MFS transporter [Solirubrobacteraceae bacterium]|nr:MFS transporter [Solirubrobacteraceae bacterium]
MLVRILWSAVRLPRLVPDVSSLRESRDLRVIVLGNVISQLGSQATLVALPYQIYVQSHSAFLVGLLGAVELGPLVASALLAGAIADRMDRRRLLLLDQVGLVLTAAGLALASFLGHPPLAVLYVLGALLAAFSSLQNVAETAIIPNLVTPARLRSALALNYGLYALTMVVGPAVGGLVIGGFGVQWAYAADAVSCAAVVVAVAAIAPQPPPPVAEPVTIVRAIADGLRYVRGNRALMGSFAIDLVAMTFGMPRALFAVLSVSVYHAGATGTGVLYSAVSVGATLGAITTGWLSHARRLGLIVIWAVVAWGAAITVAGLAASLWLAAILLAVAGAADSVSAVCRSTINQSVTPDHMRGRMSAVYSLVVTSGPRLGDIESGGVAGAAGVRFSIVSGGVVCVLGVLGVLLAFPALLRYDAEQWTGAAAGSAAA